MATCLIVIKGHFDDNDFDGVETWYDYLKSVRALMEPQAYNMVLSVKFIQSKLNEIDSILAEMKKNEVKPTVDTYYIMLSGYAMRAENEKVESTLKTMITENVSLRDVVQHVEKYEGKKTAESFEKLVKNPEKLGKEQPSPKKLVSVFDENWEKLVEDPEGVSFPFLGHIFHI